MKMLVLELTSLIKYKKILPLVFSGLLNAPQIILNFSIPEPLIIIKVMLTILNSHFTPTTLIKIILIKLPVYLMLLPLLILPEPIKFYHLKLRTTSY